MPVIQMGFDVSGLRRGTDDAKRQLAGLEKQVDALQAALDKAEKAAGSTGRASEAFGRASASVKDFKAKVVSLGGAFKALGIAAVAGGILDFQKACLQAAIAMDGLHQSYSTIFGKGGMAAQLDVIRQQSQDVGQNFMETAEAAKGFFAAAKNTSIASQMNDIFKAFSNAGAAMHLSSAQMNSVFRALGQMMSKGKVSAEELRNQMGEVLPEAFGIAAEAMGMTMSELDKLMADGKIFATDLVPKMAAVLNDKFASSAKEAAHTVQGELNRMMGAWQEFKANLAASGPAVYVMRFVSEFLEFHNNAERNAVRRDEAIAYLKRTGAKPALAAQDYSGIDSVFGASMSTEAQYSDEQIKQAKSLLDASRKATSTARNMLTQAKARKQERDALVKETLDTFGKEAGKSKTGKQNALQGKRGALTSQYNTARAAIMANGGDPAQLAALQKGYADAMASVEEQFKSLAGKGGKGKGGGDAAREAESSARFASGIEKMRNEVEALERALQPGMTTYDRLKAKIEAEAEAAIKNADVKKDETIRRKQATAAQAEELASLEKRKAELEKGQKLDELSLRTLRDKAQFYEEFAQLTGDTNQSLALQNQLIDQQAKEWVALGIPMEDVKARAEIMHMELSRSPWDGMVLGLRRYATETESLAKTMSGAVGQAFDGMADAFVQFAMTGKMSFGDMANSIIADLMRITVRSMILGPIANALGSGLSGMFTGFGNIASGGTWDFGVASGKFTPTFNQTGMTFASGGAFSGIHGFRNHVVTSPTFFSYGSQLTRFAKGGVMGEAGPEAVMPLARMPGGNLGVQSMGAGGAVEVCITLVDQTEGGVNAKATDANMQGLDWKLIIRQVDSGLSQLTFDGKSKLDQTMTRVHGLANKRGWRTF